MADGPQFDGTTPVKGYTLVHDKRSNHSYYVKGENLSNDELMAKISSVGQASQPAAQAAPPSLWQKANAPMVSSESIAKYDPSQGWYDKATQKFIAAGDPTLARIASFLSGSNKSATDLVSSFSSPISLALAAASGGESALGDSVPALRALLKTIQTGAGVGFGAQGAVEAAKGKREGETTPDEIQRRLQGLSQAALGTAGASKMGGEGLKSTARYIAGAGEDAVSRAANAAAEKQAEARVNYQAKAADIVNENKGSLATSRQAHEESVANIEEANQRALAEHSKTVKAIRDMNDASHAAVKHGADASQTANHLAQGISEALPKIADEETAKARAAYPKVEGQVPSDQLYADLRTIVDDKLKGSGNVPTSLAKILKDTEPDTGTGGWGKSTGPTVGGRHFDLSNPNDLKAYQSMKAQGVFTPAEISRMEGTPGITPGAAPISFDDLHGMYSELGRELYKGNLPGDSKAALGASRSHILKQMTDMTEKEGKLDQFNKAQRGWMVLENVFRNDRPTSVGGSPIARALNARDPITGKLRPSYVRSILSDEKGYQVAQELLGNYESTKDLQRSLGLMKQSERIAKSAPKRAKVKLEPPAPSEKPLPRSASISLKELPKPPADEPFDAAKWRNEQIQKYAIQSQQLRPFNFMPWRLPFTIFQQALAKMLLNEGIRNRIAGGK